MMSAKILQFKIACLILCTAVWTVTAGSSAQAQTTSFTYQGSLSTGGGPANGQYDFQFRLFDALTAGHQIGSTVSKPGVAVTGGLFTTTLDFGASGFPGANRWLEIGAKLSTDPTSTTLTPRQQIASTPYTIQSLTATTATNATQLGGVAANQYVLTGDARMTNARAASSINLNTATLSGVLPVNNGGTGSATQNFVDLSTDQTIAGNKTFAGILGGNGSSLSNVPGTFHWQVVTSTTQQAVANNGYVANNAGQVTITLPTTINVGDTVRVSAIGVGGWKIAQNAGQAILATSLNLSGVSWTARESVRSWVGVASSADGNKLVAVDEGPGMIYTSTDSGVTWTPRESNRQWGAVASSADGSKLVAGALNDHIYTSTDSGVNWTPRDSIRRWTGIASSADGNKLVAIVQFDRIYTSTDSGVTWTPRESNRAWSGVASSADGSKLVAVVGGAGNADQIYTSTDSGASWTPRDSNREWVTVASSSDGSHLVAGVSNGQIYTSTDSGVSWTPRDSNRMWQGVASSADGSRLVAVVIAGQIYTSTDSGASWAPRDSNRTWITVASSGDGSKLVAVGFGTRIYTSGPTTTPGTGGALVGPQYAAVELQYAGNGLFIPISWLGAISGN